MSFVMSYIKVRLLNQNDACCVLRNVDHSSSAVSASFEHIFKVCIWQEQSKAVSMVIVESVEIPPIECLLAWLYGLF